MKNHFFCFGFLALFLGLSPFSVQAGQLEALCKSNLESRTSGRLEMFSLILGSGSYLRIIKDCRESGLKLDLVLFGDGGQTTMTLPGVKSSYDKNSESLRFESGLGVVILQLDIDDKALRFNEANYYSGIISGSANLEIGSDKIAGEVSAASGRLNWQLFYPVGTKITTGAPAQLDYRKMLGELVKEK